MHVLKYNVRIIKYRFNLKEKHSKFIVVKTFFKEHQIQLKTSTQIRELSSNVYAGMGSYPSLYLVGHYELTILRKRRSGKEVPVEGKRNIQLNFLHIMLSFIHWSPLCLKATLEYQLLESFLSTSMTSSRKQSPRRKVGIQNIYEKTTYDWPSITVFALSKIACFFKTPNMPP